MRGLWDRWRLQLPARSHGLPLLRGPLSLCAACSHPSLMSSPSTGGGWSSSTGDLHPKPENLKRVKPPVESGERTLFCSPCQAGNKSLIS